MKLGMDILATVEQVSELHFRKHIFVQEGGAQLKVQVNGITLRRIADALGYCELEVLFRKNAATVLPDAQRSCQAFLGTKKSYFLLCVPICIAYSSL
jgi:hypothetical protein